VPQRTLVPMDIRTSLPGGKKCFAISWLTAPTLKFGSSVDLEELRPFQVGPLVDAGDTFTPCGLLLGVTLYMEVRKLRLGGKSSSSLPGTTWAYSRIAASTSWQICKAWRQPSSLLIQSRRSVRFLPVRHGATRLFCPDLSTLHQL
jgi:hypothetical protein